ncbi:MAG TPA: hypothetical protein VGC97_13500 [Pyrinomonadaceae bacterium]|jgi:hypothetical protein
MKNFTKILVLIACLAFSASAQTETLTNANVIEMSKIGLDKEIILKKISDSRNAFDVSYGALIELKKYGVETAVIALMMEKAEQKTPVNPSTTPQTVNMSQSFSDSVPRNQPSSPDVPSAKEALLGARTIAIEKSSINPSRQALEKELLKRKEWTRFNLSIERYKESADLFMEIGFVHFSLITHRYVWRVYDRRSGIVVAAGETTSWGSLAENIARDVAKKLNALTVK